MRKGSDRKKERNAGVSTLTGLVTRNPGYLFVTTSIIHLVVYYSTKV